MKKFTLIELIIVTAIIGILLTMLMPSMAKAKEKAKRAVCASNISQNIRTMHVYALNNNSHSWGSDPRDNYGLSILRYKSDNGYDMRKHIVPYNSSKSFTKATTDNVEDLKTWSCASTNASTIDHKNNTRAWTYMSYTYYPGNRFPFTKLVHKSINNAWYTMPTNMGLLSNFVLMQDLVITNGFTVARNTAINLEYNHGEGIMRGLGSGTTALTDNPSYLVKNGMRPAGSVLGYGDGSAVWKYFKELVDVGAYDGTVANRKLYSLPPRD